MGKESFLIYKSFYKPISKLSDKQLGRLFRAIFKYQLGEIVTVEEDIEIAFEFFKNQFEIDENKYQGIVERNRSNGSKGGAPKRAKNDHSDEIKTAQTNPNNPMGFLEPKKADNDNVNDNNNSLSNAQAQEEFPPSDIFDKPLKECYNELASNMSWIESFVMNIRSAGYKEFTIETFYEYLKRFFAKLQNEGEIQKSPKDAMSHFSRWLNIDLKKQEDDKRRAKSFSTTATNSTGKVVRSEAESDTDRESAGEAQKDYSARF
ncbi:DUF6291 domain-containing protein [Bacteroides uniformis]|uniref:DUF6291 domain-containing protein n=1 Tax=Bacteroides uniformis TaxID=820 RepID=UPI00207A3B08|nr:DUF6291 domain-containing protein [Bacteroides uniformis]